MYIAKLFETGCDQSVRLPKEYQIDSKDALNSGSVPTPKGSDWNSFMTGLQTFTDDFMEDGRCQPVEQVRETLFPAI